MAGRTIKLAAAGTAVVVGPAIASADDGVPSFEVAIEGGLTFSDYSKVALGKVGDSGPLAFENDIGGYGSVSIGRGFDTGSPYDWRLTGTITQFLDNESSYSDFPYTATTRTSFAAQTLDFDIGRTFENGNVETRIYGGVRGLHLKQSSEFGVSKIGGDPDYAQWSKLGETEFLGAGPRIGVDTRVGNKWGLVAGLSGSAIYGRRTSRLGAEYSAQDDGYTYGPFSYGESQSEFDWVGEMTANIGVSYMPNSRTEIIGGYRVQQFWNVAGGNGEYLGGDDNPTVHGPYIGVKMKF